MEALFAPAVALMNRLRYPAKFFLLGTVVSLIVIALLFSVFKSLNRDIEIAEHELAGVRVLKPLNRVAQAFQKHRGLSAGILGGNESMKDARAAQEKAAQEALVATGNELPATLRDSAAWKKILADWEQLRAQGLTWNVADNVKAHTALIDQVLLFMVDVADAMELTLDSAMDTYYMMDTVVLKMPAMLERLGQTRARGTGVLAKKEISPQMRVDITSTLAEMAGTLRAQDINLSKVVRFAPSLAGALNGASKDFSGNL